MVFKVTKGGVRSGNTLRGLNLTTTKRYGRHACLLGYTSLGRRDLTRLVRNENDDSNDQKLVTETLAKTDVLLSLNKQQRWRLPTLIGNMIQAGDFNKGAVVSLLVKHKLKRKANCVNMVSNSDRTSCIKPKNNKYFSFALDNVADSQSRREKRRARTEALKKMRLSTNISLKTKRRDLRNNVVKAFTADGAVPKPLPERSSIFDGDKPEYRLEVFYPCPRSCSLTYNPKYTDVAVVEGENGETEVKSIVKAQKKGVKTHRKRISSREVERLYCDEIYGDLDEVWDECNDEEGYVEKGEDFDFSSNYHHYSQLGSIEYTMDALLAQAKKAKKLLRSTNNDNISKHSKSSNRRCSGVVSFCEEKPHVVYVQKEGHKNCTEEQMKKEASANYEIDILNRRHEQSNSANLESVRVVLCTSETNQDELRRHYGTLYAESSCLPRRFVIDITDDVTNLLTTSKSIKTERDFSSYLVFVYDGFYDSGLSAYTVTFNSMVGATMTGLSELLPFTKMSIPNIINGLACHLLDLKEKNCLEYVEKDITEKGSGNNAGFLNSRMKLKVKVFNPSNEVSQTAISSVIRCNKAETTDVSQISEEMENDVFCDVCYVDVTSSRIDTVSGTKLTSCGHTLCDNCWRSHFRTSIADGKSTMVCGGYDCHTKVEPVTLMSILNVSEIALILKRQTEQELETMDNAKWCPNLECGRVIKVDFKSKSKDLCVDVQCACGNKLCFSCMGPAHWPAKCDQAEEYLEKLPTLAPTKEYVEEEKTNVPAILNKKTKKPKAVKVEGRLCPRCRRFIEKNGGCPYMKCRCSFQMCWSCMKAHHGGPCGKIDPSYLLSLERTLIVKHTVARELVSLDFDVQKELELPKIMKNKRRATLYQRALKQREEMAAVTTTYKSSHNVLLVSKMIKTCQQHPQFKQELMTFLSNKGQNKIADNDISFSHHVNLTSHLRNFLTTIVEMVKELHHVREYTYILLQGTPHSVAKQRILKLTNDLNGFCSIVTSILDLQDNQDAVTAFRRLVDLQRWAERALDGLIQTTQSLREN